MAIDIYGGGLFPEHEKQFEAIEAALGFKLFTWQKAYIAYGKFRQYGATTAEILRDLIRRDRQYRTGGGVREARAAAGRPVSMEEADNVKDKAY